MKIHNQNDLDNSTGKNHSGGKANEPVRILTARSILGDKVLNKSGEDLGKIEDIMLNIDEGNIEYVIIAFGGFIGVNEKYFAIPFALLKVDPDKERFILNQSKETLDNAPGFEMGEDSTD